MSIDQMNTVSLLKSCRVLLNNKLYINNLGMISTTFIDFEKFDHFDKDFIGKLLIQMINSAGKSGLTFSQNTKNVLVLEFSRGHINYSNIIANYLMKCFRDITFSDIKINSDEDGNYIFSDEINTLIDNCDEFILFTDVVNNGTMVRKRLSSLPKKMNSVICLVDRGKNDAIKLGIKKFYSLLSINILEFSPETKSTFLYSDLDINTSVWCGAKWVRLFGHPPYIYGTDFSEFRK